MGSLSDGSNGKQKKNETTSHKELELLLAELSNLQEQNPVNTKTPQEKTDKSIKYIEKCLRELEKEKHIEKLKKVKSLEELFCDGSQKKDELYSKQEINWYTDNEKDTPLMGTKNNDDSSLEQ